MGHSVCLGGAVCTNSQVIDEQMIFQQKACGLQPSPFDAWMTQIGINTLELRLSRQSKNALEFANFFESEVNANFVRYPLCESHPHYELR